MMMQDHLQSQNFNLVVPGQLIAVSRKGDEESSFLRGHGTYIDEDESSTKHHGDGELHLRASVTGTVQRVNKLISVIPLAVHRYDGNVGDLVVGRIVSVGLNRWKVQLLAHQPAAVLPLSGVHLPGGVQRMRTQQDAREMRQYLTEGDIVSAEVHKSLSNKDGASMQLHTRSTRYGKLENGCWIQVPPGRIPRRKHHYVNNFLQGKFDILLGCNGWIWMQRATQKSSPTNAPSTVQDTETKGDGTEERGDAANAISGPELAELHEAQRALHAASPYSQDERLALARLRNVVESLRYGGSVPITVESLEQAYQFSLDQNWKPTDLLLPQNVVILTTHLCRKTTYYPQHQQSLPTTAH